MKSVLVFDLDGVLADVRGSYLAAIAATVQHLSGREISLGEIEDYKKRGGWNNDWALAHELVGPAVAYEKVVEVFQALFLGEDHDGLILRETWIPEDGLLARLARTHELAIFSGRPRAEIELTLRRFAPEIRWTQIVGEGEVARGKPAPDGLHAIATPDRALIYVGDNVDDARSARAAGVRFIGVTADDRSLGKHLLAEGAKALIEHVNQIEEAIS